MVYFDWICRNMRIITINRRIADVHLLFIFRSMGNDKYYRVASGIIPASFSAIRSAHSLLISLIEHTSMAHCEVITS